MNIVYSNHAKKRLKQRGLTELEIEHVLEYPSYIKKSIEGRKIAEGEIKNRKINVVFVEKEKYIKIITVI